MYIYVYMYVYVYVCMGYIVFSLYCECHALIHIHVPLYWGCHHLIHFYLTTLLGVSARYCSIVSVRFHTHSLLLYCECRFLIHIHLPLYWGCHHLIHFYLTTLLGVSARCCSIVSVRFHTHSLLLYCECRFLIHILVPLYWGCHHLIHFYLPLYWERPLIAALL